jgi:hypothetical protein
VSPRRFCPASRVALFLAARGRCAGCGIALEPVEDAVYPEHADRLRIPASVEAIDTGLARATSVDA